MIYSENETISVHLAPNEEVSACRPGYVASSFRTKGGPGVCWKRGRYKKYSESDLMQAVEMVLAGNSLKRATEATGVPQSTITDRMAKMNLTKRKRKSEEQGGDNEQNVANVAKPIGKLPQSQAQYTPV